MESVPHHRTLSMRLVTYQRNTKIYTAYITEYTAPTLAQSTVLMPHDTWEGMFRWVQDVILESAIPAPNKFDDGPDRRACRGLVCMYVV